MRNQPRNHSPRARRPARPPSSAPRPWPAASAPPPSPERAVQRQDADHAAHGDEGHPDGRLANGVDADVQPVGATGEGTDVEPEPKAAACRGRAPCHSAISSAGDSSASSHRFDGANAAAQGRAGGGGQRQPDPPVREQRIQFSSTFLRTASVGRGRAGAGRSRGEVTRSMSMRRRSTRTTRTPVPPASPPHRGAADDPASSSPGPPRCRSPHPRSACRSIR